MADPLVLVAAGVLYGVILPWCLYMMVNTSSKAGYRIFLFIPMALLWVIDGRLVLVLLSFEVLRGYTSTFAKLKLAYQDDNLLLERLSGFGNTFVEADSETEEKRQSSIVFQGNVIFATIAAFAVFQYFVGEPWVRSVEGFPGLPLMEITWVSVLLIGFIAGRSVASFLHDYLTPPHN